MREYKGRQKRQFTVGEHVDNDNCEVHMYNPALARDLAGNIAAASLFWHIAYNVKSRLASGEVDKYGVPYFKTSYTGILHFLNEFSSKDQVITLVDLLEDQGLIFRIKSNNKNSYTLTPIGYRYAKDRTTLADKIPTAEAIAASVKEQEAKKQVKETDPKINVVKEVMDYFNTVVGKEGRFGMGKTNTSLVIARLNEGHTLSEIKQVIKYKADEYFGTHYWQKRVRPSTILGDGYDVYLREMKDDDSDWSQAAGRRAVYLREPVVYTREEEKAFEVHENLVRDYFGIDDEPDELPFK